MAYIGSFPADKTSGSKPRNEFAGDGSTVNFTLSQEVPGGFESNVLVIVDNVLQQPVESYTIGGDNLTLQFSEAPASGAVIYVLHQGNATYNMIPVVGSVTPDKLSENLRNFTVDTYTGDGTTVAYTLTDTPASANSILVIVDGIFQTKTTNYTLSGTTLTFTGAPDSGAAITVIHLGFSTVSRTAVPDGSITTAKIADNAITSAKLGFDVIVAEDIAANAITVSELQNGAVTPAKLSTGGPSWDTNGAFVIGKTAIDDTTQGFAYRSSGYISVARSGGAPAYLNRLTSTGAVLEVAYASSTKGTIAVDANGMSLTGVTGITFPATQSASTNANTLDDYEEGTWTPILVGGSGSPSITFSTGNYVKVGRAVTITAYISYSKNTLTGSATLSGLPFAVDNDMYPQAPLMIDNMASIFYNPLLQLDAGASSATFINANGSTGNHTAMDWSQKNGSNGAIRFTITYRSLS